MLLALGCKKEEFRPYDYNGEYPRNMDGSRIKTYSPQIHGGDIQVKFNGHSWNHAPYLSIRAYEMNPPRTNSGGQDLTMSIGSHLTFGHIEQCNFEVISVGIPLKEGRLSFNDQIGNQLSTTGLGATFISINCDAGKDHYKLDLSKTSWIDLTRYDKATRALEAEFNMHFIMEIRNSNFGPIYPKQVNLKGKIKAVAKLVE